MKLTRKQKRVAVRIAISTVLFGVALILDSLVSVPYLYEGLLILSYIAVGYDVVIGAIRKIARGNLFDEEFLMSIATLGAFFISEYPEACAVMLFYQVGELFQSVAVGKSRRKIAALMDIRPDVARVIRAGEETVISPEEVAVGETVIVRAGDRIPFDGVVTEGSGSFDNSALTGESAPVDYQVGDRVISGGINLYGVIKIRVEREFSESTVSRILELVENSQDRKSRVEKFISRFARWYTPAVVILAALIATLPWIIGGGDPTLWIEKGLMFLVMSCPCALVISIPLTFFSGIGTASRNGVLVKGAEFLERLASVKTFVFDKTGTLTEGSFSVSSVWTAEGVSEPELVSVAAACEEYSTHPIAKSVIEYGERISSPKYKAQDIAVRQSYGVSAYLDGARVIVGNERLMSSEGVEVTYTDTANTLVHVARGGKYLGAISVSDMPKSEAKESLADLRRMGCSRTVMLSGDRTPVAEAVGGELSLDAVYAELLPENKLERLEEELGRGGTVAFVGDGINDAPSLARADVGIAMGALGSDAAIEAADVVLMDDSLKSLVKAVKISKKTLSIAYQNVILSLGVKLLVLLFGALVDANMWLAVFADVGVMMLAILNSLRNMKSKV